jgi:cytochrome c oxidase subunit 4
MMRSALSRSIIPRRAASVAAVAPSGNMGAAQVARGGSAPTRATLADVPARWSTMNQADRLTVTDSLIAAQKGDWKALSSEQKKACTWHRS